MPDSHDPTVSSSNPDEDLAAELRRFAGAAHKPIDLVSPPDSLWDRIAAEAGVPTAPPAAVAVETEPETSEATTEAAPTETAADPVAPVRAIRPGRRWKWVAAAAAAVAVVAGVGVFASSDDPAPELVASAVLDPLADRGRGSVELVEGDDGWVLLVDTDDLDAGEGYLELWVIDPDVTELLSLGPLRADGRYELPAGFDPSRFPIVDVSVEHFDGDPTHSGDSVLRGQLDL